MKQNHFQHSALLIVMAACGQQPIAASVNTPTQPSTTAPARSSEAAAPRASAGASMSATSSSPPAAAAGASAAPPISMHAGGASAVTVSAAAGANGAKSAPGREVAAAGSGSTTPPASPSCLDGVTNYEDEGPFKFKTEREGLINFWVPMVPAGCKVPVVHLANGTGATCSVYQAALERLASHGFLTACYESTNTGAGTQGLMVFETAQKKYPDLADNKLGSTGHSQGGQAALVVTQLAEAKWGDKNRYATLAMEPASGYGVQPDGETWQEAYSKVKSPVFMFSGNSATGYSSSSLVGMSEGDGLVAISWVDEGFAALNKAIEAYHWTSIGATHIPTPQEPEQQISIPWFRWKLLGDKAACKFFQQMPDAGKWVVQKEQNAMGCE